MKNSGTKIFLRETHLAFFYLNPCEPDIAVRFTHLKNLFLLFHEFWGYIHGMGKAYAGEKTTDNGKKLHLVLTAAVRGLIERAHCC